MNKSGKNMVPKLIKISKKLWFQIMYFLLLRSGRQARSLRLIRLLVYLASALIDLPHPHRDCCQRQRRQPVCLS
jgi:hypothetical protein